MLNIYDAKRKKFALRLQLIICHDNSSYYQKLDCDGKPKVWIFVIKLFQDKTENIKEMFY